VVTGVCLKEDEIKFKKTLLRITKGNCVVYFNNFFGSGNAQSSELSSK